MIAWRRRFPAGRLAAAGLAAAALIGGAGESGNARAGGRTCTVPHRSHLIARSAQARAWVTTSRRGGGAYRVWTACLISAGGRVELARGNGFADSATTLPAIALAGNLVGYGVVRKAGLGASQATVYLRDLRTGHLLYRRHAVRSGSGLELFDAVVVSSSGALAWIGANVAGDGPVPEVWGRQSCGAGLLDSGAGVDPHSLRLVGNMVGWRNAAEVKSAPLDTRPGRCNAARHSTSVSFSIDLRGGRRAISPLIYGINADRSVDSAAFTSDLALTRTRLVRLGGNRWTGFNWENGASNAGSDYCFENDSFLTDSTAPGGAVKPTIDADRRAGIATIVTVPIVDYVAANAAPGSPSGNCDGFSIWQNADGSPNLGFQDPFSATTRVHANAPAGPLTDVPNLGDHRVYQNQYVYWLKRHEVGAKLIYELDNEPEFWSDTHPELRPFDSQHPSTGQPLGAHPLSYAELVQRDLVYARMIKSLEPGAEVTGPTLALYYGQLSLKAAPDAGGRNFVDFYLQQVAAAERRAGRRLIDSFDFHWYPQTPGGDPGSATDRYNREQNPRSLWDPSYTEPAPSYYHQYGVIRDIPRIQAQIRAHDPGMKLAITEWNYGAEGDISGGIADADALGIFGRYGVHIASSFAGANGYLGGAHRVFRNYDGRGASFGDTEVRALNSDTVSTSVYASVDHARRGRVVIVAINKRTTRTTARLTISHAAARLGAAAIYVMTRGSGPVPKRAAALRPTGPGSYTYEMPAQSVSVIVPAPARR